MPALTFDEVLKFNQNHGADGKFSSAPGGGGYRTYSDSEMHEIGAAYKGWEDGLTDSEKKSVAKYGMSSNEYNMKLRTGKPYWNEQYQATDTEYKALDSALEKSKIPENMTVYRGANSAMFAGKDPESLVGKTIKDKGYASTSAGQDVAEAYADDVICKINCKAGSKGAYIENVSNTVNFKSPIDYNSSDYKEDPGNKEIHLPRNSAFEITAVNRTTVNGKEVWEVEMTYEG